MNPRLHRKVTGVAIDRSEQGKAVSARIDLKRYVQRLEKFFAEQGLNIYEAMNAPAEKPRRGMKNAQASIKATVLRVEDFWDFV